VTLRTDEPSPAFDLVVMVGSLGGLQSATHVLAGLPADFPVPVLLLLHGRPDRSQRLADVLRPRVALPVRPACSGDVPSAPGVVVVPPGWTGVLESRRLALTGAHPGTGGDVLLRSVAEAVGPRLIAVVLTGLLRDGTDGVRAVKRRGGRVLVEDPVTARAGAMPASALATGCVDFALPNTRIAAALMALALAPGGAELFSVATPAWASLGA
jgi:two-component system chemotaxis response regulator CheB